MMEQFEYRRKTPTRHHPIDIPFEQNREYERGDDAYLCAKQRIIVQQPTGKRVEPAHIRRKFYKLFNKWFEETAHLSLVKQQTSHLDFLKIVGMGETALPYIFQELKKIPMLSLMIALEAIVGFDVASKAKTQKEAVNIWLDWANKKNLLKQQ